MIIREFEVTLNRAAYLHLTILLFKELYEWRSCGFTIENFVTVRAVRICEKCRLVFHDKIPCGDQGVKRELILNEG